jgi:hypothetical protein
MIKRADVAKRQEETHDEEIKRLETAIDKALSVANGLPLRMKVDGYSGVAIKKITQKYETEGGYTITRDYGDQRDPANDLVLA